jgi:hypothetical protein
MAKPVGGKNRAAQKAVADARDNGGAAARKPVTIRDVALVAGVSPMTVTRVRCVEEPCAAPAAVTPTTRQRPSSASAQRVRVPPHLLVHAREDLLLPAPIPGDADAPVGLGPRCVEQDRAARIVLAHDEVKHRVVQGAVGIVQLAKRVLIATQAVALRLFVAGDRIL